MKLHPLTHIIITIELAIFTIMLPTFESAAVLSIGLIVVLLVPSRTEARLSRLFLKVLAMAAFFLLLIHGVRWNPPGISQGGMITGLESFINIAVPFTCIMYLSRRITSEELFAVLIDLRIPSIVILILFRTLWLVPRLMERMEEVVTAQKLRGMRIENSIQRAGAILPTLSPIFSSMLEEISENSLTLTTRGFLQPGGKSHITEIKYNWINMIFIIFLTLSLMVLWF
ncbi:energy-coupling factor transporter transmembrane component T family protein [Candidatus Latescibacterota bacterium]